MVKVMEADNLIDHVNLTALSNVGIEVFTKDEFWGTALANDIYPEEGRVIIEVYLQKSEPDSPYEYRALEDNPAFVSDFYDAEGEEGIDDDSEIVIRFVDLDNNGVTQDYEPCAVWANIERDEITFTVKTPVFESEDAAGEAVLRDCQETPEEDTEEEYFETECIPDDVEDIYTLKFVTLEGAEEFYRDQITDINIYKASEEGLFVAEKIGSYWKEYNVVKTGASFRGNKVEFQPCAVYLGSEENLRKLFELSDDDLESALAGNSALVKDYGLDECMVENAEYAFKAFYVKKISEYPDNPTPTPLLIPKGTRLLIL